MDAGRRGSDAVGPEVQFVQRPGDEVFLRRLDPSAQGTQCGISTWSDERIVGPQAPRTLSFAQARGTAADLDHRPGELLFRHRLGAPARAEASIRARFLITGRRRRASGSILIQLARRPLPASTVVANCGRDRNHRNGALDLGAHAVIDHGQAR